MASKTVVELFDDLDGGRADETVRFALDGVEYEIDLSSEHATSLRDTLAVYIGHAHRPASRARRAVIEEVRTKNGRNGSGKSNSTASMTAEIRRLASESASKVSKATRIVGDDETTGTATENGRSASRSGSTVPTAPPAITRPVEQSTTTVGPVPALVIPFLEAGL